MGRVTTAERPQAFAMGGVAAWCNEMAFRRIQRTLRRLAAKELPLLPVQAVALWDRGTGHG